MQAMQVFHNMEDTIKEIITASIDDAKCSFEGDSCNLKVVVTSNTFSGMSLIDQHKTKLERKLAQMLLLLGLLLHRLRRQCKIYSHP